MHTEHSSNLSSTRGYLVAAGAVLIALSALAQPAQAQSREQQTVEKVEKIVAMTDDLGAWERYSCKTFVETLEQTDDEAKEALAELQAWEEENGEAPWSEGKEAVAKWERERIRLSNAVARYEQRAVSRHEALADCAEDASTKGFMWIGALVLLVGVGGAGFLWRMKKG
ncbi:hypothetical protein FIV42_22525 [Persicimonas caeni]|uniref:Uncharacterized protein n=1 Tax=Persicimonas caeni TaxID=2292766 RepID=A0A4Y6PYM0_PERCE|nr:hypothetical protein [Persicimonas caeni]QDG53416.1 hypothetical protein FIV42_22525 [Persicimonas caeni]QED34637.1 hypothetical protein FRD00_22520 [Persicimonas caeni]